MSTTNEIRRANLRALAKEVGGMKVLADRIDVAASQLSQWLHGSPDSRTKKPRGLSHASARKIEQAVGKTRGWLDIPHETFMANSETHPHRGGREVVTISQFETGGSMGSGLVLRDQPGVIQSWRVSSEWVQNNVKNFTATSNLCVVTGFGDSMRPLYNPGDPLLVDRGVTKVEYDAIYFFRVGGEGFIKRLQRIPGRGLVALSENTAYRDWTITDDMDFEVLGRVLKLWRGEDY